MVNGFGIWVNTGPSVPQSTESVPPRSERLVTSTKPALAGATVDSKTTAERIIKERFIFRSLRRAVLEPHRATVVAGDNIICRFITPSQSVCLSPVPQWSGRNGSRSVRSRPSRGAAGIVGVRAARPTRGRRRRGGNSGPTMLPRRRHEFSPEASELGFFEGVDTGGPRPGRGGVPVGRLGRTRPPGAGMRLGQMKEFGRARLQGDCLVQVVHRLIRLPDS